MNKDGLLGPNSIMVPYMEPLGMMELGPVNPPKMLSVAILATKALVHFAGAAEPRGIGRWCQGLKPETPISLN